MNRYLEIMENGMFTKIKNTIFGYNIISPVQKECEMLENKSVYLQRAVFIWFYTDTDPLEFKYPVTRK